VTSAASRADRAGLALQRRSALAEHLGGQRGQVGAEQRVRRGAGGRHRAADAARLVRPARHPGRELGAALPGKDQVGVRVHEAGQHGAAGPVHHVVGGGRLGGRAGPGHLAVVDDQRRVVLRVERAGAGTGIMVRPGVTDQFADVGDQRAHGSSRYRVG
jgi:hypothetical protein